MIRRSFTWSLVAAFAGIGCAGTPGVHAKSADYDSQACAEDALRRGPDPELAEDAAEAFTAGCATRDAAACSMLGVAYELGLGVPKSLPLARDYYRHACEAGNARACGNLGELLLASGRSDVETSGAVGMLAMACAAGQARHCAVLGRAHTSGGRLPPQQAIASSFLERACHGGDGHACFELARELERSDRGARSAQAFELLVAACSQGDPAGCSRLSERTARARALVAGVP